MHQLADLAPYALPPEINSHSIYSGPGPASLDAAAMAWEQASASTYDLEWLIRRELHTLSGQCSGRSATLMIKAFDSLLEWCNTCIRQLGAAEEQTSYISSAYVTALRATIPPDVIRLNRI